MASCGQILQLHLEGSHQIHHLTKKAKLHSVPALEDVIKALRAGRDGTQSNSSPSEAEAGGLQVWG